MLALLSQHMLENQRRRNELHGDGLSNTLEYDDLPEAERLLLIRLGYLDAEDAEEDVSGDEIEDVKR